MTPTIHFDPEAHEYRVDGVGVVPSVTTVLKYAGLLDFDGIPLRVLHAARERGRRVHLAAQYLVEGALDWSTVDPADRPYVEAAARFIERGEFAVVSQERRVFHALHRYAGTVDLLGTFHGAWAVADYKTSAGNPADLCADLQLAAYAEALRAEVPIEWWGFEGRHPIVRLGVGLHADGTFKVEQYRAPSDWTSFLACLAVVRLREQRGRAFRKGGGA